MTLSLLQRQPQRQTITYLILIWMSLSPYRRQLRILLHLLSLSGQQQPFGKIRACMQ
jgi:hypothetical protein